MSSPNVAAAKASGFCRILLAFDIGYEIDLDHAEELCSSGSEGSEPQRPRFQKNPRALTEFGYSPAPLRLVVDSPPIKVLDTETTTTVELTVFDFAAVSVAYRIELDDVSLESMVKISDNSEDVEALYQDAKARVDRLMEIVSPAVKKPLIHDHIEDYIVWELTSFGKEDAVQFLEENRPTLARIVAGEHRQLSQQEIDETLSGQMSYSPKDCLVVHWHSSLAIGPEDPDQLAVLEFTNIQHLALTLLSEQLDDHLIQAQQISANGKSPRRAASKRLGEFQIEGAVLFEAINNALKLVGDHYLARVHRLALKKFRLDDWDSAIQRKLSVIDGIYQKMQHRADSRRLEFWEILIVIFFAIEIYLSLGQVFGFVTKH